VTAKKRPSKRKKKKRALIHSSHPKAQMEFSLRKKASKGKGETVGKPLDKITKHHYLQGSTPIKKNHLSAKKK